MNFEWGDEKSTRFITNVGLITSNGSNGQNIMACEWTHHISYSPALIAVCIGPGKATHENIQQSKEFGVSIASTDQIVLSSISGTTSAKSINKIKALEELGFKFYKAKKIKTLMVKDSVLNAECKLIKEIKLGSHTMFIGEVIEFEVNTEKTPLALHQGEYGKFETLPKTPKEEREEINKILAKHKK
ncbi:MAG: flavin reductase family protein [Nanoarchaeota archaeon]|mgnify:FL=1